MNSKTAKRFLQMLRKLKTTRSQRASADSTGRDTEDKDDPLDLEDEDEDDGPPPPRRQPGMLANLVQGVGRYGFYVVMAFMWGGDKIFSALGMIPEQVRWYQQM